MWALAAGMLAAVLAVFPGAALANTSTVVVSANVVVVDHVSIDPGSPGAPGGPHCAYAVFLQVQATPGIQSYQASVTSNYGFPVTTHFAGPPFPDDSFTFPPTVSYDNFTYHAPAGTHEWLLEYNNAPTFPPDFPPHPPCNDAFVLSHYSNPQAQGVQQSNRLSGKVTDAAGQGVGGVTVTAASTDGGGTYSTSTASNGSYSEVVSADSYSATPSRNQDSFQPSASTVDLTAGDATANFTLVSGSAISAADVTVNEPASGSTPAVFVVTLDHSSPDTATVDYATQDATATVAHRDYTPVKGTLTFAPGDTSQTVSVSVNATGLAGDRAFSLVLSNPQHATIARATATGTIKGSLHLDALKPTSGSPAGGNALTLTGRGFGRRGDNDAVKFAIHCSDGSNAQATATQVTVLSGQKIRATVPADPCPKSLATGPADVSVEIYDASGNPTDSNPQTYTYRPEYVALGDSYSAGEGTGNYSLGPGCKRSPEAYGPLISAARGFKFDFRACSGARTTGVIAQSGALSSSTTLVTLTVGGNDAGFSRVIETCSIGSVKACQTATTKADSFIASQLPALLDASYSDIASRASNAIVVVLGYPHLFTSDGRTCGVSQLTSTQELQLNQTVDLLDGVIVTHAAAHGFTLVDPRAAFSSHEVCSSTPWLNGLSLPTSESYHPNVAGQAEFASLVEASLP